MEPRMIGLLTICRLPSDSLDPFRFNATPPQNADHFKRSTSRPTLAWIRSSMSSAHSIAGRP